jgi:hypothetical protein
LYLNVKIRDDSSIYDVNNEKIDEEKEPLRHLGSLELIEYIKSSIEVLISMQDEFGT